MWRAFTEGVICSLISLFITIGLITLMCWLENVPLFSGGPIAAAMVTWVVLAIEVLAIRDIVEFGRN